MKQILRAVVVFVIFGAAGCDAAEEELAFDTELRGASPTGGTETSELGIIEKNPIVAFATCTNLCVEIGCNNPYREPAAEITWLGEDKWLCSCSCVLSDGACEFIDACWVDEELYPGFGG